jgi:hypothetical protein
LLLQCHAAFRIIIIIIIIIMLPIKPWHQRHAAFRISRFKRVFTGFVVNSGTWRA